MIDCASSVMSSEHKHPKNKHRHDGGDVDHGAIGTAKVTSAIQVLLGATVLASVGLTVYALRLLLL